MRCLSASEAQQWARARGLYLGVERTHREPDLSYPLPELPGARASLAPSFAATLVKDSSVLVEAADWPHYRESEMRAVQSYRARSGEYRHLIEAPGHLFSRIEEAALSELLAFLLGTESLWTFRAFTSPSRSTFYFWEGAYLDFWGKKLLRARELGSRIQEARTA